MFKNLLKIIVVAPLLMAFQCDDELESTLVFNNYNVQATPQASFSVNDTIWLTGLVSSKAYDLAINDSVFYNNPQADILSIMKFIEPTQTANCIGAINKFELINELGSINFLSCENAELTVHSNITSDSLSYKYKIGLKALQAGDYIISWQNSKLTNHNRNTSIAHNYPIEDHQNQIGFNKCGNVSWRYLNESEREYYFTVE